MKRTVTDKLCDQALRRFGVKLENEYERLFPYLSAPEEFWEYLTKLEERLVEKLKRRPMTRAEIDSYGVRAYQSLRIQMVKIAGTVKQPIYEQLVNIETGETRLIPTGD